MEDNMKVSGRTIRCMEKVHSSGQMEESMKENTSIKKNRVTVNSHGQMADAIRANGGMESKTEREFIVTKKVLKDQESGLMERKSNGQIDINLLWL